MSSRPRASWARAEGSVDMRMSASMTAPQIPRHASLARNDITAQLAAGTAAPQKPSVDQATSCGAGVSPARSVGGHVRWWVTAETSVTVLGMTSPPNWQPGRLPHKNPRLIKPPLVERASRLLGRVSGHVSWWVAAETSVTVLGMTSAPNWQPGRLPHKNPRLIMPPLVEQASRLPGRWAVMSVGGSPPKLA